MFDDMFVRFIKVFIL